MKVAFATQDLVRVDAHFGWARHLVLYDVSPEGCRYLKVCRFSDGLCADGDHAKMGPKLKAARGCVLVFAAAIGPRAVAGLVRQRATAVQSFAGRPIDEALQHLQSTLRVAPQRWLRARLQAERRGRSPHV